MDKEDMITVTKHRPKEKGTYELFLWKLDLTRLEEGCFRGELRNEGRLVECFDLRLTRAKHRQWLEGYVSKLDIDNVWFSTTGLLGDNWYTKEAFRKNHAYCNLSFLEHLNIK